MTVRVRVLVLGFPTELQFSHIRRLCANLPHVILVCLSGPEPYRDLCGRLARRAGWAVERHRVPLSDLSAVELACRTLMSGCDFCVSVGPRPSLRTLADGLGVPYREV